MIGAGAPFGPAAKISAWISDPFGDTINPFDSGSPREDK